MFELSPHSSFPERLCGNKLLVRSVCFQCVRIYEKISCLQVVELKWVLFARSRFLMMELW